MELLPKDPKERKNMLLGMKIVGDFGASIAVPVVVFVMIGQWLEGKYGHEPYFTIAGFVLAALVTARIIYKKAKEYNIEYQNLNQTNNIEKDKKI